MFFVDCEASSLSDDSYPIEVAWVDENGQGESYLIRPEPTWTDWSVKSQAIHGIPRSTLIEVGHPAKLVAKRAFKALKDAMMVSDNPAYDGHWLSMLFKLIDAPEAHVVNVDFLIGREIIRMRSLIEHEPKTPSYYRQLRLLLDEGQILAAVVMENKKLESRHQHLALSDAENLWLLWKAVHEAFDKRLKG